MPTTTPTGSNSPCRPSPAGQGDTTDRPGQADVRTLGAVNTLDPRLPGRVVLIQGDAAAVPLPDNSVDLVVTSPPYWAQRSYLDGGEHYAGQLGAEPSPVEYLDRLVACTAEWARVLKPAGSIFVNLGDKYAARANAGPSQAVSGRADRAECRPPHPPITAYARDKSLLGLPWQYALRCIGAHPPGIDPDLAKSLLADVATGALPLAVAEDLVDRLAQANADGPGLVLRAEILWHKTNGMPESVKDRARRTHEHLFHFTRSARYYADLDTIREPHNPATVARSQRGRADAGARAGCYPPGIPDQVVRTRRMMHPGGALPGSVWTLPTRPLIIPDRVAHWQCCAGAPRPGCPDGLGHYAAYPLDLPQRLIAGWCPPGGVVLDPCGGTGTTALVAAATGRTGISIDRSADYTTVIARWRTNDTTQIAHARGVPVQTDQLPGQGDLFGGTL